jgi:hypothetical protein
MRNWRNLECVTKHGRCDPFRIGVVAFLVGTAGHVEIDSEVAITIFFHQRIAQLAPLFITPAEFDFDGVEPVLHALDMRAETNHFAIVRWNHFVDTVTKQETTVHRGNAGFFEWHVVAI